MKNKLSKLVIVCILSITYVTAYMISSPYILMAKMSPAKLTQHMKYTYEEQNDVLVEFETSLKNLSFLYGEIYDINQPKVSQAIAELNIFGWISLDKESQKINFQLGLKHVSMEVVLAQYTGYFFENKIYVHNTQALHSQIYVMNLEGDVIQSILQNILKEIETSMKDPVIEYQYNSAIIVVPSSVKYRSNRIPINIEIDEKAHIKKFIVLLNEVDLNGLKTNDTHENRESSIVFHISSKSKEIPLFSDHDVIQLDETNVGQLFP